MNKYILVIDDNQDFHNLIKIMTRKTSSIIIDSAFSSEEAIEKIESKFYHFILVDTGIAFNSSIDLLNYLKKNKKGKNCKIIAFSEMDKQKLAEMIREDFFDDFLKKPFSKHQLFKLFEVEPLFYL